MESDCGVTVGLEVEVAAAATAAAAAVAEAEAEGGMVAQRWSAKWSRESGLGGEWWPPRDGSKGDVCCGHPRAVPLLPRRLHDRSHVRDQVKRWPG